MDITHGGDIYTAAQLAAGVRITDFSANVNPFGTPERIRAAVRASCETLSEYPDPRCRRFCRAAGEYHSVMPDAICAGAGAADVIFRLVHAVRPRRAAVMAPTFGEYERALSECGCSVTFCGDKERLRAAAPVCDMVFICNPNNPTGELTERDAVARMAESFPDTLIVVDECFLDMTGREDEYSMIPLSYKNVFVLRSLTKMYALAGLRIGYGICADTGLCERVRRSGQAWSVSTSAQRAGETAFLCAEEKDEFLRFLKVQRQYLYGMLTDMGLEAKKPTANFVFFRARGHEELDEELLKRGFLIRSCGDYRGLCREHYRVCVREREDNERLCECIRKIIK